MDANNGFPRIPDEEFGKRMAAVKEKMEASSIDLLVVFANLLDPSHVRYLSDVSPLNESAAVVIPLEGQPILCSGQACQAWSAYKSKIKDIRILPEVGEVGGVEYEIGDQSNFSDLFEEIRGKYKVKRIGTVGTLIFPQIIHAQIGKTFSAAEIVDAEKLIYEIRVKKSENEIACMQKAASIIDGAFAKVVDDLEAGMTELDIQAEIEAEVLRRGGEDHALSWTPMIPSGPQRTGLCMNRNSMRRVKEGEIIDLQAGALYEGYNAALCTPPYFGQSAIPFRSYSATLSERSDALWF